MASFNRDVSPLFISALQDQPWWPDIVADPNLFIAIRDGYINIYYQGCSLARIRDSQGGPKVEVHYKYLVPPELQSSYVTLVPSADASLTPLIENLTRDLGKIERIKRASRPYAGLEKTGVHKIIMNNPNVIDVEVALALDATDEQPEESTFEEATFSEDDGITTQSVGKRSSAKRIDLAALCENEGEVELVMYEAKLYSDSRIKAQGNAKPTVIHEQIEPYARLLEMYKPDLERSYRRVTQNLVKLRGEKAFARVMADVAEGRPFTINTEPRLIVFGFDADQRDHRWGKLHLTKLREQLTDRVLAAGNPENIRL